MIYNLEALLQVDRPQLLSRFDYDRNLRNGYIRRLPSWVDRMSQAFQLPSESMSSYHCPTKSFLQNLLPHCSSVEYLLLAGTVSLVLVLLRLEEKCVHLQDQVGGSFLELS